MLPTAANGQPAVGAITVTGSGISRNNVVFQDPSLFAMFGLPPSLEAGAVSAPA